MPKTESTGFFLVCRPVELSARWGWQQNFDYSFDVLSECMANLNNETKTGNELEGKDMVSLV